MVATLLQEQDDEWKVADRRYFRKMIFADTSCWVVLQLRLERDHDDDFAAAGFVELRLHAV